jgi:hypothetical protein
MYIQLNLNDLWTHVNHHLVDLIVYVVPSITMLYAPVNQVILEHHQHVGLNVLLVLIVLKTKHA